MPKPTDDALTDAASCDVFVVTNCLTDVHIAAISEFPERIATLDVDTLVKIGNQLVAVKKRIDAALVIAADNLEMPADEREACSPTSS